MYSCEKCEKEVEVKFGSGKFCSRKCANSRIRTEDTKKKISIGVRNCNAYAEGRICAKKGKSKYTILDKICPLCGATFKCSSGYGKKFCSSECVSKNPLTGGYRPGSGRSKSGWYKNFYCGSTWELAFLIWALDHKIPVERCAEKFKYEFEGTRTYLPDFVVGDLFVEIKGYDTEQTRAKIDQFPKNLVVLREEDLEPVFSYVKTAYGANFYELYEGNPHNQKKNSCKQCGKPCRRVYCSQRCSIFGNHAKKEKLVARRGADPLPPG